MQLVAVAKAVRAIATRMPSAILTVLLTTVAADAANTCNAFLSIDYPSGPAFAQPGDVYRVSLEIGSGAINGGTQMQINRVRFQLDCSAAGVLGTPCTDAGALIEYQGDTTITTTCPGVVFSTSHPVSTAPNEVLFTPSAPILIPASTPSFCRVEFDIKVISTTDADPTPTKIEQVAGYLASTFDAVCDNGLQSSGSQSGSIDVCPTCTDSECSTAACNPATGTCDFTPKGSSTPCNDTDGDACTTAGCDGLGNCNQMHMVTVCPPDNNECTNDPPCNPATGICEHPPVDDSTPCTDTDGDACTTAGCDGAGNCNQNHIMCVTTTTTTSTTTTIPQCIPVPEVCDNMFDDDCDTLVDCLDPDCFLVDPCPPAKKDPTDIRFQDGMDRVRSKAVLEEPGLTAIDLCTVDVGILITNPSGKVYSVEIPGSALTPSCSSGNIFRYRNLAARTDPNGGLYSLKIKKQRGDAGYAFSTISYADMSATDGPVGPPQNLEQMRVQFYVGERVFITIDSPWKRTPSGWKAPKDH